MNLNATVFTQNNKAKYVQKTRLGKEVTNKVGRQMDSVVLDWDLRYECKLIVFKYMYRHIDTEVCMCMYTYTDTQISQLCP